MKKSRNITSFMFLLLVYNRKKWSAPTILTMAQGTNYLYLVISN